MCFLVSTRDQPAHRGGQKFGLGLLGCLGLLGLAGLVSCSTSWHNQRFVYVRNYSSGELRLTWKISRARRQETDPGEPGAALIEPNGGVAPALRYSAADTVLDNYEQALPIQSQRAGGDSLLLTIRLPPGTTYLVSSYQESFRQFGLHQYEVAGCTFLPCTVSWVTAEGQRQQRFLHPLAWRQAQDREAQGKWWTNSYTLVRYVDYP
jgi:hypothetical protein